MTDKKECCDSCNRPLATMCTVCNRSYEGCSRDHLRSDSHKLMKNLLASIKDLPEDEIMKLAKKYYKEAKTKSESPKKAKTKSESPKKAKSSEKKAKKSK